jgi:hypothetical protein
MMDADVLKVLFMLLSIGLAGTLTFGSMAIIRAFARRIERGHSGDLNTLADQVEYLRQKVEEGEGAQARIAELEERLEFTERMLAQQREAPRLPDGGGR